MIKITLSPEELKELEKHRNQTSSPLSEKALMVIMNHEGKGPHQIAETLQRNPHTVRKWLKQYKKQGIQGLHRLYSPGRPNDIRKMIHAFIEEIIDKSPREFHYQVDLWTIGLIVDFLETKKDIKTSADTVERALRDLDYTYKRPVKGVPEKAPSREEKIKRLNELIAEIKELQKCYECEICALDESHFSNEPYLIKGWQKKRWPPEDFNPLNARVTHDIWLLECPNKKILLEKIEQR